MRIIFMGSPDFAVPSLDKLIQSGYNVVAVITATDKMGGRGGKKVLKTPVKMYAENNNIPVLQPKNLKNDDFIKELRSYEADLQIVVAFRMLPVIVWDMPNMGTYNLHGSLLPKYRGAAPINWAVINGEHETGVTSFKLKHAIDTGDYLFQETVPIAPHETAGEVYEKMRFIGADVIVKTVKAIEENNELKLTPQDENLVSKAPKIFHDTCEINWNQHVQTVYNFIRGMSPFPTAWTTIDEKQFDIIQCTMEFPEENESLIPGTIEKMSKKVLRIHCIDGYIYPNQVKMQGKRKMSIVDFMNGYPIEEFIIR